MEENKIRIILGIDISTTCLGVSLARYDGKDIEILKIDEISVIADYLIIASGRNQNQLNAMIDFVEEKMTIAGFDSKRIEGNKNSSWVLMDYGDVIVHVFSKEDRLFYDLERIWKDGKKITRKEFDE